MLFKKSKPKRNLLFFKGTALLFLFLMMPGVLSCTKPTGSTSGSSSGTGSGWTVTVTAYPTSASTSRGEVCGVIVQARDSSGSPAVKGTLVCVYAHRGGFLKSTDESSDEPQIYASICESTTNDIGQLQAAYVPLVLAEIETSPGEYKKVAVAIDTGPDTITGSAMGSFGNTQIQVTP
jgi:hypothetical protein